MNIAPPTDADIESHVGTIETRLRRQITRSRARGPVAVAIGLVAVTGLIFGDVVGLAGWRGGADVAAAQVLEQAALQVATADVEPGPGQYLLVETHAMVSGFDCSGRVGSGPCRVTMDQTNGQLWIPADHSNEWVWFRTGISGREDQLRAPGGDFYGQPNGHGDSYFASLPRDAYRMLNGFYREAIASGSNPDDYAFHYIADLLRTGNISADLRAELFRAVMLIPGVEVIDEKANLDGRTGVSVGRVDSAGLDRDEIIIDPDTGLLVGERTVYVRPANGLAAGTVISYTAVTTSIVDSAPDGGTLYGNAGVAPG